MSTTELSASESTDESSIKLMPEITSTKTDDKVIPLKIDNSLEEDEVLVEKEDVKVDDVKVEDSPPIKVIVFYTGYSPSFNEKDPNNKSILCYGSELCTKNVAETLVKRGYEVHIFSDGNFKPSKFNGVVFHNVFQYNEFQKDNEIDVLIISRYINFFIYCVPRVKKILFWSHDTTVQPFYDGVKLADEGSYFTLNMLNKLDRYIALTETHKNWIWTDWLERARSLTDEEKKKFIVIGNGLNERNFDKEVKVERIKNRFIYSSDPDRALALTLDLFQRIHAVENSVTLEVFHSNLRPELKQKIDTMPYVHYNGKVSQEQLAIEMQKSDFWLYPTHFYETYCMVGLECQMAGVIPIVRKLGGLIDTVGDRGLQIELEPAKTVDEARQKMEEFCDKFVIETLKLILDEPRKDKYRKMCMEWARTQNYNNIVDKWIQVINE